MRLAVVGVLLIAAVAAVGGVLSGQVDLTRASPARAEGEVFALVLAQDDKVIQFLLVDPAMTTMATYQLNRESGEISLKSVRNFRWDLQMMHYNSGKPLPSEIRSMLEGQ
jgi:hypothetical protein